MRIDTEEIIDQAAHAGIAALVAFALTLAGVSGILSVVGVMTAAYVRELYQHQWMPRAMGPGSYCDLAFFLLGSMLGVVLGTVWV